MSLRSHFCSESDAAIHKSLHSSHSIALRQLLSAPAAIHCICILGLPDNDIVDTVACDTVLMLMALSVCFTRRLSALTGPHELLDFILEASASVIVIHGRLNLPASVQRSCGLLCALLVNCAQCFMHLRSSHITYQLRGLTSTPACYIQQTDRTKCHKT